jgi:ABC-type glycerol-3-phosphate transport system substrate-binding protein
MVVMKKMAFIAMLLLALALTLAACGSAKEKIENQSAEGIAEKLIEQSTGVEDVDIDLENNSVAIKDENGEGMAILNGDKVDLKTFSAVGYQIPLPDGVVSGEVSRFTDENGEETGVTGTYMIDGSKSLKEIFQELDKALTDQGLTFTDPFDETAKEPDFSDPQAGQYFYYTNGDGVNFFITSFSENMFTISGTKE